ncbi:flagellar biosynthetic protein FliO [Franconibacter helveticus 513]|uniref:flagellar biosynthetic protein FliO n=1 Tax=Franconibacter helveticus TaxID=357240 RepID=UPI000417B897|nr:flagellar biosynthetic protein FliO [Franconibacter helveticus]MDU6923550.1 flagellar biosynthetic protein FliO [Franconibacter helveticus]
MKTTATMSQPLPSAGSSLIQVSGALTLIILVILLAAWVARRFGFAPKHSGNRELKLSSSISLGNREKVVIVDVEDARLVLGVTASQITHLHTLPPKAATEEAAAPAPGADFQQLMKTLLKRNGRK